LNDLIQRKNAIFFKDVIKAYKKGSLLRVNIKKSMKKKTQKNRNKQSISTTYLVPIRKYYRKDTALL